MKDKDDKKGIQADELRKGDTFEKAMRPFMQRLRGLCLYGECRRACSMFDKENGCSVINQGRIEHRAPKNTGTRIDVFRSKKLIRDGEKAHPNYIVTDTYLPDDPGDLDALFARLQLEPIFEN